jgi:AcrR family transcriptional regulator
MPKVTEEYKEKRKEEILEIAGRVFIEKGFEQTTMTDVVEASGLSRGGVYKYFSSTDEMFWAIQNKHDEEYAAGIINMIGESETAWQAIETFLDKAEASYFTTKPGFGIVQYEYAVNSARKKSRSASIVRRLDSSLGNLARFIHQGVQTGEFKPVQPTEAIVLFMVNILDGILLHRMLTFDIVEPERVFIKEQISGLKSYLKNVLQFSEDSNEKL